ncbi:uncharacterized protein LOC131167616 [Malania oleifera]|uniref:uncharacterized protein LOC131167616 n=1 Tax=Malania oleifera TaxID=397392 RepID=UPI0025AE9EED|nr:uncharacterized protein LOC131167616 [Malania oleifera]
MEMEQPMFMMTASIGTSDNIINGRGNREEGSKSRSSSIPISELEAPDEQGHPFETLKINDIPCRSNTTENKLSWLHSQVIGTNRTFISPFGERRITYADHTSTGRSLRYIENFILNNVLPFYGNTHTSDSHVGQRTTRMVNEASTYIKSCLGGRAEDAIMFCGSGTTAAIKRLQEVMGIVVPSTLRERVLKSLSNEERWVVFVGPYEHHSNILSWRQSLAEVVEIGLDDNGLLDVEALRMQLQYYQATNRPMLGSFSACSNVTGLFTDARALAQLLHQFGAFACFDFAASGPYVEINMQSGETDGYDAIFLSPHKFLGGPGSPGVLLMSKVLYQLRSSPPSTCGGGTVEFANCYSEKDTLYYEDVEERENAGTPPLIQTIRAALAFWVKEYIGYEVIETIEHKYIQKALQRLFPNPNILVLGNTNVKRQAILSFLIYSTTHSSSCDTKTCELDNEDGEGRDGALYMLGHSGSKKGKPLPAPFVAKLLNDLFGIQARGGCSCAGPYGHRLLNIDEACSLAFRCAIQKGFCGIRPGWARISFPYYMTEDEFEFILTALEFVSIYGQRFLPLYHFNWKTGNWTIQKKALKETLVVNENTQNLCDSPLTSALGALKLDLDKSREQNEDQYKEVQTIHKFATYLDTATYIASHLPKFPRQRRIPYDIQPKFLHFRV